MPKVFRTIRAEGNFSQIPTAVGIDQNQLPYKLRYYRAKTLAQSNASIMDMRVRGAGAIGGAAAIAAVQAFGEPDPEAAINSIRKTRPTARNLFHAVEVVYAAGIKDPANSILAARIAAEQLMDEDITSCESIGQHALSVIKNLVPRTDGRPIQVMTQCNAGWLAFVGGKGSALAGVYAAHEAGMNIQVIANETRPRGQGARLTAWELGRAGIKHWIAPDTMVAYLMEHDEVDAVFTGADRIAANGDTANKIGTQGVARLARDFGIPFYIAAPTTTFDLDCSTGAAIPIEQRSEEEVLWQTGQTEDGRIERVLVAAPGSRALNTAFDVTPAGLIRGIITEQGIVPASQAGVASLRMAA